MYIYIYIYVYIYIYDSIILYVVCMSFRTFSITLMRHSSTLRHIRAKFSVLALADDPWASMAVGCSKACFGIWFPQPLVPLHWLWLLGEIKAMKIIMLKRLLHRVEFSQIQWFSLKIFRGWYSMVFLQICPMIMTDGSWVPVLGCAS